MLLEGFIGVLEANLSDYWVIVAKCRRGHRKSVFVHINV